MNAFRQSTGLLSRASYTYTRPLLPPSIQSSEPLHQPQQIRPFFSNPLGTSIQTLSAKRTVPYPSSAIYAVVSDVANYAAFIPFCRESTVTKHSSPDKTGRVWPEEAKLVVGYSADVCETFWSRVYCVPESVVEAVAGAAETTLAKDLVAHHSSRGTDEGADPTRSGAVLTHLLTRWTLRPVSSSSQGTQNSTSAGEQTEVDLAIEYQFANPFYAGMSAAAAPKVAEYMIGAFEKRVQATTEGSNKAQ